ncbi:hypothetical protein [Desulfurivibrio dismutans]|uniref:hypothetical protein n=1 Tax=Desulfurivibrio dismutans TaxID=1398908 RepID=UPI0023DA1F0E|nr:hypothetical protein [Desulfurivibrio alkaliphilus]MDF1615736.1 hypothetical protein [Desulfurivibrio alkaliphilus]
MAAICKICSNELEVKYYKKYGLIVLISCLPMFPLLMFIAYGTIIPFLYILFAVISGILLLLKKERYFYYCSKCKLKKSRSEVE